MRFVKSAEIAWLASLNAKRFLGVEPRVALLSFSTKGSAGHPRVRKVRAAYDLFCERGYAGTSSARNSPTRARSSSMPIRSSTSAASAR